MAEDKRIFVDSNYFVALFNSSDTLHQKSLKIAKDIDALGIFLVISNLVFLEIVTVLSQRRGKRVATEVGEYLLSCPQISLVHIDELFQKQAWDIFRQIENKDISFVDCSIIAAMKGEGISQLLTFDIEDFKQLQRRYYFRLFPPGGVEKIKNGLKD